MSAHPLPVDYQPGVPPATAGLGARPLRVVDRHADPDALALAKEAADRRAAASTRPVQRGTSHDPGRHRPLGLHAPIDGQLGLFSDPAGPTQLALFGDAVAANEGEL